MVFMGSERYPGEGEFDQFVQRTGGDANAATDAESTVFHFYTQRKHLREGTVRDGTELSSSSKTRSRQGAGFFSVCGEAQTMELSKLVVMVLVWCGDHFRFQLFFQFYANLYKITFLDTSDVPNYAKFGKLVAYTLSKKWQK